MAERLLNLYVGFKFTDNYWNLDEDARKAVRLSIASSTPGIAAATHLYAAFPTRADMDFYVWCCWHGDEPDAAAKAFVHFGMETAKWRPYVQPSETLFGFTKPSQYSRGKSEQDMDPLEGPRTTYLIVYPFSKTKDWYLMSMDSRQGMMNEHIKIGKQFFDVKQLLVYSFGLQDQEFVVSYEVNELHRFSDLVYALRDTEGRRYTLLDTPIITGVYRTSEEFVG